MRSYLTERRHARWFLTARRGSRIVHLYVKDVRASRESGWVTWRKVF